MKIVIVLLTVLFLQSCAAVERFAEADLAAWQARKSYVAPTKAQAEAKRRWNSRYYQIRSDMRWRETQQRILNRY